MKNWRLTTFIVMSLFVAITSCKKDDGNNEQPITPTEVNESIDQNGYTIIEASLPNGIMYFRLLSDNKAEVVGRSTFYDNEHIDEGYLYKGNVSIPSSFSYPTRGSYVVTSIDELAFANCINLLSIDIPTTIVSIGSKAFSNCVSLTTVTTRPNSPPRCDASIFNNCTSLRTILVPDDKIAQYQSANGWINYKSIIQGINGGSGGGSAQDPTIISTQEIVNNQGTVIVEAEFEDGSKMYFAILSPTTASVVNRSWFYIDGNETQGWAYRGDIIIPSSFTHLGTNYTITEINHGAFASCPLVTSIIMPNTITTIGNGAFSDCLNMTHISTSNSLTSVGYNGFKGCSALECISLPNSLTVINNGTFWGCTSLTELALPTSLQGIGTNAFSECSGLTEISLPLSLQNIGPYAFSGVRFESIIIPRHVQSIGIGAFEAESMYFDAENCSTAGPFTKIKEIVFSENVTSVPSSICNNNTELENVVLSNTITIIGEGAFSGCSSLASLDIPNSVEIIGTHIPNSSSQGVFQNCIALTTIVFGNNLKVLDNNAFLNCTGLTSVVFDNSKANIGYKAFSGCTNLTNVNLGDSIVSISAGAFYNCCNLYSISIPNSTYSLGNEVFFGCTNLHSVVLGESIDCIPHYAFYNCSSITSIAIPNSALYIGERSFQGCTSLTSITISDNVNSISNEAFKGCSNLESLVIGQSVEYIARGAFDNCNSLSVVNCLPNTPPTIGNLSSPNFLLFPHSPLQVIYVPLASVEDYNNASGWKWYENKIVGI